MKNLITLFFLALATFCAAQTNQVKTPGVSYSAGAPNWVPVVKTASELAIDTVSKRLYLWNRNTGTWDIQGQGIDNTSGGTPPAYTPGQTDSKIAINNASPPELYAWTGSAWAKVGGTVQTIDTFSISGSIVSLSLSGDAQPAKTITLPASGITSLTGDVTASGPGSVAATIANGAVNGAKLASGAVSDSTKVGANVIEQSNIDNGAVWARHLARMGASTGQVLGWNGSVWGPTAAGSGWGLTGNAATAGSSFLGTTNNTSLRFRTNNVQRMILDSLGNLQVSAYIKYDGTVLARDNRDNSLWTQSASSVASNRDMQIGNGTYSTLRFVIRGIGFGSSVATSDLVSNWFFASGFTSTGTNGLAFKIVGQNAAAGNFNGGSILLDGGAKSGTGSDGNIILGSITGSVGVGTASPAARLHVQGAGATSANTALLVQNSTPSDLLTVRNDGKVSFWATNTATGTTGARTIDRPSGTVNFAAGASTLVVANSLVTTASIVFAVVRTNDTTATIKNVVPAAGSFTITLTANATAETSVGFFVIN